MNRKAISHIRAQVSQAQSLLDVETTLYDDVFCSNRDVLSAMGAALRALDEASRQLTAIDFESDSSPLLAKSHR